MSFDPAAVIAVPDDVLAVDVADETVLLNTDNGCYYGLDDVGTDFWNALKSESTLEKAFAVIRAQFDVDEQRLWSDLTSLVAELEANGLLVLSAPETDPGTDGTGVED